MQLLLMLFFFQTITVPGIVGWGISFFCLLLFLLSFCAPIVNYQCQGRWLYFFVLCYFRVSLWPALLEVFFWAVSFWYKTVDYFCSTWVKITTKNFEILLVFFNIVNHLLICWNWVGRLRNQIFTST